MAKYRCLKRLTTDNHRTIHEVGDIVDLSGDHEKEALRAHAVEPVVDSKTTAKPSGEA